MIRRSLLTGLAVLLATGCTTYQPLRDTTQPGKLRKASFTDGSEWFMMTTVIDAPFEAAFTFPGEASDLVRVKWVLEENHLFAYKTYEVVGGTEFMDRREEVVGEPTAAYRVEHLDVWKQYNPVSGEEMPVVYESRERPWWKREFVRVDWSTNHVKGWNYMMQDFCKWSGDVVTDPVGYYPTREGDPEQFFAGVRGATDADFLGQDGFEDFEDGFCEQVGGWCNVRGWDKLEKLESLDYLDVINREFVRYNIQKAMTGIDIGCWPYPVWPLEGGLQITQRVSFMKVPESDYQPLYYPDAIWEKFGYFRTQRDTYDPGRGITDLAIYLANRWNIWEQSLDNSGRPLPVAQRAPKPLVYYYIPESKLPSTEACAKGGKARDDDFACVNYIDDALYQEVADQWSAGYRSVLEASGHPQADTVDMFQVRPIDYTCGPTGDRGCQQIGDLRYSFMWNHDLVSSGAPLGYGPSFADPKTGEIIAANANFYGGALRSYSGLFGDYYDLIKGNITELEIITGENVRDYFENMGGVIYPPSLPIVNLEALAETKHRAARGEMDTTQAKNLPFKLVELKNKLDGFKRTGPRSMDRRSQVVGTWVEKQFITPEYLAFLGEDPNARLTEDVLSRVSPFRESSSLMQGRRRDMSFWSERSVLWGDDMWTDLTIRAAIERTEQTLGGNASKSDVVDYLLQRLFVGIEAHEVGHTTGLMHNFEGSADEDNYHPEYFEILAQHPHAEFGTVTDTGVESDFDVDGDGVLSASELQAYQVAYRAAKEAQEAAGADLWASSAIMDYNGTTLVSAELAGVGRYEHAALKYGYAQTIEVYSDKQSDFDAQEITAAGGWDSFKFKKLNRVDVPFFSGGERCNDNSECPAAASAALQQRCRSNLGQGGELRNGTPEDLGVCSSVWKELEVGNVAHPNFRYCSDYRREDKPFCNVWDEGKSAQDIVENLTVQYESDYIFNAFRRYRVSFPMNYDRRIWGRYFVPIGKIYQSLLYNYYYMPGFAENGGPGGMLDSFLASRQGMNFFARVLGTPDIGSYVKFDPSDTFYDGAYSEAHEPWADFYVPIGVGKYLWSAMEQGELGAVWRFSRIGTFYDKWMAIEALTTRDWGLPDANDETYPINYYDAFQEEMIDLFTSIISEDAQGYAPVIRSVDPTGVVKGIEYRDIWKGGFFGGPSEEFYGLEAVKGWDTPPDYSGEVLDAGGSINIRSIALLYAMFDFPVFFDNTFPSAAQLYLYGKPSAKDIAAIQSDPAIISYLSPDRTDLYATVNTEKGSVFAGLIQKAQVHATTLTDLRAIEASGTIPPDFMDKPENQLCRKILSSSATPEECLSYRVERTESQLESVESFLRVSRDYLDILGYQTQ